MSSSPVRIVGRPSSRTARDVERQVTRLLTARADRRSAAASTSGGDICCGDAVAAMHADEHPATPDALDSIEVEQLLLEHCRRPRPHVPAGRREPSPGALPQRPLSPSGCPPKVLCDLRQDVTGNVIVNPGRSDRHPVAERFGHGDDVGSDAVMLGAEPRSVLPMPVCTSSTMSSVSVSAQRRATSWTKSTSRGQNASFGTDQFEQHCAAVSSPIRSRNWSGRSRAANAYPRHRHEPLFFLADRSRPERPSSARGTLGQRSGCGNGQNRHARPQARLNLIAASLASAPELEKNTLPRPSSAMDRSATRTCGSVPNRLDVCGSVLACLEMARATSGCAWPRDVTARPDKVDVFGAVDVVQMGPAPRSKVRVGSRRCWYGRCVAGDPVLTRRRCAVQPHRRVAAHWPVPSQIMVPIPGW